MAFNNDRIQKLLNNTSLIVNNMQVTPYPEPPGSRTIKYHGLVMYGIKTNPAVTYRLLTIKYNGLVMYGIYSAPRHTV